MAEHYLLPLQPLFPFVVSPQYTPHVGWNGAFDKANATISSDLSPAVCKTEFTQYSCITNTEVHCGDCRPEKRGRWCYVLSAACTVAFDTFHKFKNVLRTLTTLQTGRLTDCTKCIYTHMHSSSTTAETKSP